jgi:3,4-dihydroxy 2-butanone 4-phosphate synthase / GTP cyclohydrolase II
LIAFLSFIPPFLISAATYLF